ncbi:MAG: hypothetical protein DDT25_01076 [Chloroflexi bacterium]|nr:hypothetical protein [Chloroflexota bacterium]
MVIAAAISAVCARFSPASKAKVPIAVITWVPFIRATPSFASRVMGWIPASPIACLPGILVPL